ncbi:carbon monoxide dehydrogenase subunit G [Kibdelosporangium banguiense]|uniref:Carbon monoxide dehydrogenase subunit G n=1 Tax=Kibdelosporangium banguiense TaxID=1365924 RepID=A0ABS4TC36_9PSEU|nr:SRPBCC family protein [Kibdelosporangium banguiense]MBP2321985.1 carbon monoxide dehydrogenase subunit G [Kibdelosporangium banguiense]
MKLTNEVHIAQDPAAVFETLLDVERVAGCMPGSKLTGQVDDSTYSGEVKVKVGPLGVAYTGTVKFLSVDPAARVAILKASGREQHGQGNADAHVTARVVPDGTGSKVAIETDLMIRGKVAQFGRGVIGEVSQRLIDQFAQNVEKSFTTNGSAAPVTASAAAAPVEEAAPALDGLALVATPLLKRFAPVAAGVAIGLLAGLGLRRKRVIEIVIRHVTD